MVIGPQPLQAAEGEVLLNDARYATSLLDQLRDQHVEVLVRAPSRDRKVLPDRRQVVPRLEVAAFEEYELVAVVLEQPPEVEPSLGGVVIEHGDHVPPIPLRVVAAGNAVDEQPDTLTDEPRECHGVRGRNDGWLTRGFDVGGRVPDFGAAAQTGYARYMSDQLELPLGEATDADLLHYRVRLLACLSALLELRSAAAEPRATTAHPPTRRSVLEDVRRHLDKGRNRTRATIVAERLDAAALRELYHDVHSALAAQVRGQEDAVRAFALAAIVHVATDAPGQRILLVGPSGVGKSTLCRSVAGLFDLPVVHVDALDLTGPGWSGAPSIGDAIQVSLGGADPDSLWARRAVIVIDEVHHARLYPGLVGNSLSKRAEVLHSLLGVTGGGVGIQLGDSGRMYRADDALVVLAGAFTDLTSAGPTPTIEELVAYGFPYELVTRMQEVVTLRPLAAAAVVEILERWPAILELQALAQRLGAEIQIAPQTLQRVGRVVAAGAGGATVRTGAGWLLSAVKAKLISVVGGELAGPCLVSPDCLRIPRLAGADRRRDDGPDEQGTPWRASRR